ncbi:MAG: mechanosensitive ion channel family protein [Candidatus Dadabacteria bacterium]|nr:MAG: mechanosensitive ion channel family protein [Candidatus Dadabacteria bacterium]
MENILERHLALDNLFIRVGFILLVSFLSAVIVRHIIGSVVLRLVKKTRFEFDDQLVGALKRPVTASVFLIGCWYAVFVCNLSPTTLGIAKSIFATLVILIWAKAGISICTIFVDTLSSQEFRFSIVQPQTRPLFMILSKGLVIVGAAYFISIAWGRDVTAWLASAGIVGIAVGFAAKDTLANLFSGIFILADGPYKLGHYIVLDNGLRGKVTDIGIRSTRILTPDDIEVIVPNALIANSMIINESGGPYEKSRVRIKVSVAYGSDLEQVENILLKVASDNPLIEDTPAPRVRFREFGDSALNLELLAWIAKPALRGKAIHHLNLEVYKALSESNIEIPFPQRDIHIKTA